MALVLGQEWYRDLGTIHNYLFEGEGVDSAPVTAAEIPERLAVNTIRAGFGDGVDHPAGRAAVLRGVVRAVDLEFLNRSFTGGIAYARPAAFLTEECLVVVRAIHCVVVEQPGNPAEADEAEAAIRHRTRCSEGEKGPAAAVDRQILDRRLIDVGADVGAVGHHHGSFALNFDDRGLRRDAQRGVN